MNKSKTYYNHVRIYGRQMAMRILRYRWRNVRFTLLRERWFRIYLSDRNHIHPPKT